MVTRSSTHARLALLPMLLAVASCGDRAADPPCGGVENNGVCLYVSSIMPEYRGANTPSVDVTQTPAGVDCPNGESALSAHSANITLGTAVLAGGTNSKRITIESYNLTFTPVANAITPPTIDPVTYGEIIVIDVGSSVTKTFNLFSNQQKMQFEAVDPHTYPSYDVTYTFRGKDEYGREVYTTAVTQIEVGDYLQAECF